jgi:hypothetical protein
LAYLHGVVFTQGIDRHDLISPGHTFEALPDVLCFVASDDDTDSVGRSSLEAVGEDVQVESPVEPTAEAGMKSACRSEPLPHDSGMATAVFFHIKVLPFEPLDDLT